MLDNDHVHPSTGIIHIVHDLCTHALSMIHIAYYLCKHHTMHMIYVHTSHIAYNIYHILHIPLPRSTMYIPNIQISMIVKNMNYIGIQHIACDLSISDQHEYKKHKLHRHATYYLCKQHMMHISTQIHRILHITYTTYCTNL